MKLSALLPTVVLLLPSALALNVTELSNGADLAVSIVSPAIGASFPLKDQGSTRDVELNGLAHVGKGKPDVAYIYVIDSSDSTSDMDGACGSTLDCVQAFFGALHEKVTSDGSALLAGVVDFDDDATVTANLVHPSSDEVFYAIHRGYSSGGTACSLALEKAAVMALDAKDQAGTVVVIFAGDGQCNGGFEYTSDPQGENVTDSANILGNTGAIVHSIAVGDMIDCDVGNDLVNIPRNGGACFNISNPNDLPELIDDLIGTELTSLEVMVDGKDYEPMMPAETDDMQLPQEGAIEIPFRKIMMDLFAGDHEVCVRATGKDSLGDVAQVEECHKWTIDAPPTQSPTAAPTNKATPAVATEEPEPTESESVEAESRMEGAFDDGSSSSSSMEGWKIFLVVAACVATVAVVVHQMARRSSGIETDQAAASEASAVPPIAVDHGVPVDAPSVV